MITKRKAQFLLNKYQHRLVEFLSLESNKITIKIVESTPENNPDKHMMGSCSHTPEYKSADIFLFYDTIPDEKEFIDTLCHEMSHVFIDSYQSYHQLVSATVEENGPLSKIFNEGYRQADELAVTKLAHSLTKFLLTY